MENFKRGGKMKRLYDHVKLPDGYASERLLADRKMCADLIIAISKGDEDAKLREVLKPGVGEALERVIAYTERSGVC